MLPAEKREIVNASIAVHFTMVLKDWGRIDFVQWWYDDTFLLNICHP